MDLDFVRAQFPALQTPWALFDNAGGSVPARQVIERITEHLSTLPVQLGASYDLSRRASANVDAGRAAAARLVGASPDEVVLGASSTSVLNRLARALRPTWREGDEVIVTDLDHEANVGGWRRLEETGIRVREWPFDLETQTLRLEDLEPLLNERTRLVAFTHCSNVVGNVHDVGAIASRVREAGALTCVDGVAYAPHRQVDVRALGVDFYALSFYKVYGPHVGLLYGRKDALLEGRSLNHYFYGEHEVPQKYEPGGTCYELVAGLPGILDYLEALDDRLHEEPAEPEERLARTFDAIARHEMDLARPLLGFLAEHPRVTLYGSAVAESATRVPTVAFSVEGRRSSEIVEVLDGQLMAARWGHFYAKRAIDRLGLEEWDGVVRVSLVHYNSAGEVLRLVEALDHLL